MKKIIFLLICLLLLTACNNEDGKLAENEQYTKLPYESEYERISKNSVTMASPPPLLFFDEAVGSAELVVRIKIKGLATEYDIDEWGEDYSVLVAEVVEVFNINSKLEGSTIYILQTSSSKMMWYEYPLFKSDDEFLLCLNTLRPESLSETETIPIHYIINGKWGVLQVFETEGNTYVVNRAYEGFLHKLTGKEVSEEKRESVLADLYDYDPILKTHAKPFYEIYEFEVLFEYLEGLYD